MSYFDNYCEKGCKLRTDVDCDYCPAYPLSEKMESIIWRLEDERDELQTQLQHYEENIKEELRGRRIW